MADYFFVPARHGEFATEKAPLFVNCAGDSTSREIFTVTQTAGRVDWSIYYMVRGEMDFSLGAGAPFRTVGAGTLVLIPPLLPFAYRHTRREDKYFYSVHFTGNYAAEILENCYFSRKGGFYPLPVQEELNVCFHSLMRVLQDPPDAVTALRASAALISFLTLTAQVRTEADVHGRFRKSLAYLHEHFAEPIPKKKLAEMEGLGISQYNLLFHRLTGYSPAAYITKLRVSRAELLLGNPLLGVREVAEQCGYSDPLYFSRVFRRETGKSPREYRQGLHEDASSPV